MTKRTTELFGRVVRDLINSRTCEQSITVHKYAKLFMIDCNRQCLDENIMLNITKLISSVYRAQRERFK